MLVAPKITIITATYYRPDLLARCIKSVQSSTFKEYEHLIVSDHCPKARQVYNIFKEDVIIESLMSFKRSGASAIVSYFALDVAKKITN